MNIAFRHSGGYFIRTLATRLREALGTHTFHDWIADEPAPSHEIEILLAVGPIDRKLMEAQSNLALVQTTSAGHEGVDLDAATELGIWVAFAPSGETGNAVSVAEFAVFHLIAAARRVSAAFAVVREDAAPLEITPAALYGKSACIVGLGTIGHEVVKRLQPFGLRLSAVDEHPENAPPDVPTVAPNELREAVRDADYVVLCAPGGDDTTHLFDAGVFGAMKHGAIVVNIARGSLIDERALADALRSGRIAAAGLDVVEHEPANAGNPLVAFPQVVVTPHVAGQTQMMLDGTVAYVVAAVEAFAAGTKPAALLNAPNRPRRSLAD